ncbi:Exopolyphosphatase [Dactylellina cionopaga]|nr:Exopolyphosphatase [Dactylellina cionopaga]
MKLFGTATNLLLTLSVGFSSSLKIIINNDDGWATANIRELYKALRADGHDAYIVAPIEQQSGQGGRTVFSAESKLSRPGQWDTVSAGAPSFGSDPMDSHIWYYNGTPAAVTFFALDYLVKRQGIFNGSEPDLIVTGPNEGSNAGPFVFTLSGTVGAAYAAVGRGIPSIAFSATDILNRKYTAVNNTSTSRDPATIIGKLAAKVVNQLEEKGIGKNGRLLPYGYGLNVNFPYITTSKSTASISNRQPTCDNPPFVHARLTGGAATNYAAFNEETGIFTWAGNFTSPGVNACINGDCELPGETDVIKECKTAVSVWTIDYDAPSCGGALQVRRLLDGLVEGDEKGSNGTGSATTSVPAGPVETGAGVGLGVNGVLTCLMGTVVVIMMML